MNRSWFAVRRQLFVMHQQSSFSTESVSMVIRGRVQNGVVILEHDATIPDGTEVTVVVHSRPKALAAAMTDAERQRYCDALDQLDTLPNENPGDDFSGVDHDRALYGERP